MAWLDFFLPMWLPRRAVSRLTPGQCWCPRVPVARDIIVITECGAHNGICHQADWCYKALVTANSNTTTAQRAGKNGKSISFHEAPFSRIVFIFIPYFGQSSPSQPGNKCTLSDPFTNLKLLYREDIKTQ